MAKQCQAERSRSLRPNQFPLPSGPVITEHPILFQTEMVKAILEGRKTQTRRTKGFDLINEFPDRFQKITFEIQSDGYLWLTGYAELESSIGYGGVKCPYGMPGDLLWVRETWGHPYLDEDLAISKYLYKADWNAINQVKQALVGEKWKPSIHMPKSACRIWAMVEDIRVERVQDISEEDAEAEGVFDFEDGIFKNYFTQKGLRTEDGVEILLAKGSFQSLWCSINGLESWNANPWIWVIRFRILSTTGKPSEEVIEQNYLEVTRQGFDSAQPDKGKEASNA